MAYRLRIKTFCLRIQTVPHREFLPIWIVYHFALGIDHHGGTLFNRVGRPSGLPLGARMPGPGKRGPHSAHVQRGFFAAGAPVGH